MTAQVIHIYPTREPPPQPRFIPAAVMNTPKRRQTAALWRACHEARRGNGMALCLLRDMVRARPSDRLACVAAGTLASLGHEWVMRTRGSLG